MEGTDSGACPSDLLLTKGGGRSGALGRRVSALASRKALCRVVSMMNFEDVNCDLGSNQTNRDEPLTRYSGVWPRCVRWYDLCVVCVESKLPEPA